MLNVGPLAGLRVLVLEGIGPAPYCAMLLADLGADVVQISRPSAATQPLPVIIGRGQRAVSINLKDPAGPSTVLDLVEHVDVLIEPYRPGVAERLGIGPDACLSRNPRLIYGRMTGWGQEGPWAMNAGHDITYIAVTGVLNALARSGERPHAPLNLLGDFAGGTMFLLTGILAALWERDRSGQGQVVDAAMIDGAVSLASAVYSKRATGKWSDEPGTNLLDSGAPFYDVYETADHKWVAIGALEPQFFAQMINILGLQDVPTQHDRASWPLLRDQLSAAFRARTRDEWATVFAGTDACVAPVLTFGEAAEHEQLADRGTLVTHDGVLQPAPAPRFSRSRTAIANPGSPVEVGVESLLGEWTR